MNLYIRDEYQNAYVNDEPVLVDALDARFIFGTAANQQFNFTVTKVMATKVNNGT